MYICTYVFFRSIDCCHIATSIIFKIIRTTYLQPFFNTSCFSCLIPLDRKVSSEKCNGKRRLLSMSVSETDTFESFLNCNDNLSFIF